MPPCSQSSPSWMSVPSCALSYCALLLTIHVCYWLGVAPPAYSWSLHAPDFMMIGLSSRTNPYDCRLILHPANTEDLPHEGHWLLAVHALPPVLCLQLPHALVPALEVVLLLPFALCSWPCPALATRPLSLPLSSPQRVLSLFLHLGLCFALFSVPLPSPLPFPLHPLCP